MKNQVYCGEIHAILAAFVAAMDGGTIVRSDLGNKQKNIIACRWIVGSNNATMYDIVNGAHNITLPVAFVSVKGMKHDAKREQSKIRGQQLTVGGNTAIYRQPVPVTISVSVTMTSNYMSDIYQMFTNFSVYCRPYIILSTMTPSSIPGLAEEMRTKATWDGSYSMNTPDTIKAEDDQIVSATANFDIETYIFEKPLSGGEIITKIVANHHVDMGGVMVAENQLVEPVIVDAAPSITNIFCAGEDIKRNVKMSDAYKIEVWGRRFWKSQCCGVIWQPVSGERNPDMSIVEIDTIRMGKVWGYEGNEYNINPPNKIDNIVIPSELIGQGDMDMIIYNNAGYVKSSDFGVIFQA